MKALTLWEPWASLMASGAKTIETRSWPTRYRGLLLIHAAKRWQREQWEIRCKPPFSAALAGVNILESLGRAVAVVNLFDCQPTDCLSCDIGPEECSFGNYEAGRFGFLTKDVRRLKKPFQMPGARGIFEAPVCYCDGCDGTGLMEGWNRRDGHPCPKCWGDGIMIDPGRPRCGAAA